MKMVRVFITGSSDGIGQLAAKRLADQGHQVVLHARNQDRAASARAAVPKAEACMVADLASLADTKKLASEANKLGPFDAIIHNAGIGFGTASEDMTPGHVSSMFAVNTLAPYVLACLMDRPAARLLFMSSGLHRGGDATLRRGAERSFSYNNTKLHDVMLANAFARRWPGVQVVSMDPGWVATKMGGSGAGSPEKPARALAEWAAGEGKLAKLSSGTYFTSSGQDAQHPGAGNVAKQEELLSLCREISGCPVPGEE